MHSVKFAIFPAPVSDFTFKRAWIVRSENKKAHDVRMLIHPDAHSWRCGQHMHKFNWSFHKSTQTNSKLNDDATICRRYHFWCFVFAVCRFGIGNVDTFHATGTHIVIAHIRQASQRISRIGAKYATGRRCRTKKRFSIESVLVSKSFEQVLYIRSSCDRSLV